MYQRFFKRIIDIVLAFIALVILFPFLLIAAILIKIDSSGPVFFFQDRLGYKGNIFKVYKFRTMTNKKRVVGREILKGDAEVTKVGGVLRRFKIDELPQILNVLKGDMSVVGPRPALPRQINEFNEVGKHRILVKPGLTGLAQINGNIYLSWEERWEFDKKYVDNVSFLQDISIILKTFLIIFVGEDKFVKK